MKIMIATQGMTLDSKLADRLESASWFLLVDTATGESKAFPSVSHTDVPEVLSRAKEHGIETILSGNSKSQSRLAILSDLVVVVFGDELTAREALERWQKGEIKHARRAVKAARNKALPPYAYRLSRIDRKIFSPKMHIAGTVTPRGRHRIQQYAGRGH